MSQLQGLNALSFTPLVSTASPISPVINDRNVAEHTNRGPDASIITDGVFAPEGHDATDTAYAIVLLHNADKGAIVIDLGTKTTLCGVSSSCNRPNIQADNDDVYQLDYSVDGVSWSTFGQFKTTGGSGLHTRNTFSGSNLPATFSARYVAVYGVSGGSNFSISELLLFDTTNTVVSIGKADDWPRAVGNRGRRPCEGRTELH